MCGQHGAAVVLARLRMRLCWKIAACCACALALLAGPAKAWSLEATLTADAHVSSSRPAVNSGSLSNLYVGAGYTALVQFDLSLLPAGTTPSQVSRAILRLYCNRVDTAGLISLQSVGASWGEYSVTYATTPPLSSVLQVFQVTQAGRYIAVDVTSVVQGWLTSPASNDGLALTAGTAAVQFDSKENDQTAHPASLDITLSSQGAQGPSGALGPAGPAGAVGAKGDNGSIGPVGPAGPSGGLTYQGSYTSRTNYGAGDIVTYNGSSYVSVAAGNHGNTPGLSAANWGLLAAGGAAGSGATTTSSSLSYQGAYVSTTSYSPDDVVVYLGSSYVSLSASNHGNTPSSSPAQWGVLALGGQGVVGPQGPAGVQGVSGDKGAPGLGYVGTYKSTANYGVSDVVGFQGSSYISLLASNHGNTPSSSPIQWGLLAQAQVGATGAMGTAGTTGATGPSGAQGPPGPAGPPGSSGAVGAQGLPGLTYQGVYASTTNYKLGDVVLWQGTSYTSLAASNHGSTPALNPEQWGVLSSQGPSGTVGAMGQQGSPGPQGIPGSVGPNGERGSQGEQGIAGQAGAQGILGQTGATGLQGPMGPQGVAGPVGMSFRGLYSSSTNYGIADGVTYSGAGYVSTQSSNLGNTPDLNPLQWTMFAAPGAAGAVGPAGLIGPVGQSGVQGLTGAIGPAGPAGATGAQGPSVANYTGVYSSATNYSLHDAVSYAGSTFVSLMGGNVGNTPDQAAQQWAVLVARGVAGRDGSAGLAGLTGSVGAAGIQGLTGLQGPPVSFRGSWSMAQSYAVGDGVSYSGSSYVAMGANVGRQPDMSPLYWALVAQSGSQGPTGPGGPQGLQGPTGYAGPAGPTGPLGPSGAPGPAGAGGTSGATGPAGPTGAPGATGSAGLTFRGVYQSAFNYAANDTVTYQGSTYLSTITGNQGHVPTENPSLWSVLAAQGLTGANGAPGTAGLQGATGPQGPQGLPGADGANGAAGMTGIAGLHFAGIFGSSANYALNDAVFYQGSTYISTVSNNVGQVPSTSSSWWSLVAQAGAAGATGPTGSPGSPGAAGVNGVAGPTGSAGTTGQQGAIGMNYRGGWTSGAGYQANDAVSFAGSTYLAALSNSSMQPDLYPSAWTVLAQKGDAGPTGPTGLAGGISIGTVTTGAPGSAAMVTNSGSSAAAVLNFSLPQGAAGANGTSGGGTGSPSSTSGLVFQSTYHSVSYLSTYYSVNGQSSGASELSGAVLTWVPGGCTATKLMVYSQQGNSINVTLREGGIGSLSNTALACTAAPNSACTATGSVSVTAGMFVDLIVTGANSTASAVWTVLACD